MFVGALGVAAREARRDPEADNAGAMGMRANISYWPATKRTPRLVSQNVLDTFDGVEMTYQ
jgi:hypothetical protein